MYKEYGDLGRNLDNTNTWTINQIYKKYAIT